MAHITINFRSNALNMPVMLDVLLPEDCKECKTLYLLHGDGGDRESFLLRTRIAEYVEGKQIAVVMPSGNNKFFINNVNGKAYQDFVVQELISQMETWFCVSRKPEDRFIAGAGTAGFGALLAAVDYPDMYHTAFAYNGLLYITYLLDTLPEEQIAPVFGTKAQALKVCIDMLDKLDLSKNRKGTKFLIADNDNSFMHYKDWSYLDTWIQKTIEYIVAGGDMEWQ